MSRSFVDFVTILAAFLSAHFLRFNLTSVFPMYVDHFPPLRDYVPGALVFAALWVFYMYRKGVYDRKLANLALSPAAEGGTWLMCGWKSLIGLMAISFALRNDMLLSRQVYAIAWPLGWGFLMLQRHAANRVRAWRRARRGEPARHIVLIGSGPAATHFAEKIDGLRPRCRLTRLAAPDARRVREALGENGHPDFVLDFSDDGAPGEDLTLRLINACEARGITLYALPDKLVTTVREDDVSGFLGVPLVRLQDAAIHPVYAFCKRVFDIVFSLLVLVLGLPLWIAVALAVKCTSPGGVFYGQRRVGEHGRLFTMVKFRSMRADADEEVRSLIASGTLADPVFNIRNDPRVTPLGHWLRRTSLDEIPQLWNVLRGEMSWIGPRPEREELVALYTPFQRRRLKARPGITGYQQVASRGDPSLGRRVELDLFYMKQQGFWMDFTILLRTVGVVFRGDGMK